MIDAQTRETGKPAKSDSDKPDKPLARQVIEENMLMWQEKLPPILRQMIKNASKQGKPIEGLKLFNALKEASEHAVDCAHKLAPFQTPKLESIAVKSEVQHQFVIRAPQRISSINEWMERTGAEVLKIENGANGANGHTNGSSHPIKAISDAEILHNQIDQEERIAEEQMMLTADSTEK